MKFKNDFKQYQVAYAICIALTLMAASGILLHQLFNIKSELLISTLSIVVIVNVFVLSLFFWFKVSKSYEEINKQLSLLAKGQPTTLQSNHLIKGPQYRFINRINARNNYLKRSIENLTGANIDEYAGVDDCGDVVKDSITLLSKHLEKIRDDETLWKNKEEIRTWSNQGIAKFSELLRSANLSNEESAQDILKELVRYVNATIGGFFVYEQKDDDEPYLKMLAAYAYNRNKIADKKINYQDGLHGAVCFEKQTIFMTEIPDDYLEIRSGLGGSEPKSLLLVPLLTDDELVGVVELASFNEFKKHEIEFVEKVASIIASDFSVKKMSNETHRLLEQSQLQTKELAQQEEELRQNMEEMQAQQEEMELKKNELEESEQLMRNIIDLVPFPIFVKNIRREYIMANQEQAKLFNVKVEALLGRSDSDLIHNATELNEIARSDSKVLDENETIKLPEQSISLPDGTRRILQTIKVPFVNNITNNRNILGVSIDYTEQRKIEAELFNSKEQIEMLEKQLSEQI